MGYMKSLDLSERFSKLSDAQKNAVINIMSGGTEKIHPSTYKALQSRELIIKKGESWELEAYFKAELLNAIDRPEPREVDGDSTPENFAQIIAEVDEEYDNNPMSDEHDVAALPEAPYIPFLNRAARREVRRNIARANRRQMYDQGKRIKKYGVLIDPKWASRFYFGTNEAA